MNAGPETITASFALAGEAVHVAPHGSGHIHDTYRVVCRGGAGYILQRLNERVFPDPDLLVGNIRRVTTHLADHHRRKDPAGWDRKVLNPVPTRDGAWAHRDPAGGTWRVYDYIPRTRTHETVRHPAQARALGRAFGEFQAALADFDGELADTIPDFHNTAWRVSRFEAAVEEKGDRSAGREIDFARSRAHLARALPGTLPRRIAHNDCKLNNLLFDEGDGSGLCVIDLDTVMPGSALHDFGDMVRSGTPTLDENATALAGLAVDLDRFEALAGGYLEAARSFLTEQERSLLAAAGQVLTYETGLRFLTDHLNGDVYFKVGYPGQNLDRARNQFRLVELLERTAHRMDEITAQAWEMLAKK